MGKSKKWIAVLIVSIFASLFIGGQVGYNMNVNAKVEADVKSKSAEYNSISSELESIKTELEQNKSILDEMNEFKQMQSEVAEVQTKLDDLTAQVSAKQAEYDTLTANVEKAVGEPKVLPAGSYLVGNHVPAGRYKITGDSNFFVRNESGSAVVNIILGGRYGVPEYITDVYDGQTIETRGGCTLTPVE